MNPDDVKSDYERRVIEGIMAWVKECPQSDELKATSVDLYNDYRRYRAEIGKGPISRPLWGRVLGSKFYGCMINGRKYYRGIAPRRPPEPVLI